MPTLTILDGAPFQLLTETQRIVFDEFCRVLGTVGGRSAEPDRPVVDETELHRLLVLAAGDEVADTVCAELRQLPGNRLRAGRDAELDWYALADRIGIYDSTPDATFTETMGWAPNMGQLIDAVQRLFPSLEPELIDPQVLPARITALARDRALLATTMRLIYRNLGWWAAFGLAIMIAAAGASTPPGWAAWPLYTYILAAGLGGWTLTVIGSCVLSQV